MMQLETVARVCHEANAAYCRAIGDYSQTSWADAPEWQKQSAVNGVKFHVENPTAGPSGSHDNWLREKLADGWKYGPVKDPAKKEHPCCVSYDQLPTEQKAKDYIFTAIVKSLVDVGCDGDSDESQMYDGSRYCKKCDTDTQHKCFDSGHERDSSHDWRECIVCGTRKYGM